MKWKRYGKNCPTCRVPLRIETLPMNSTVIWIVDEKGNNVVPNIMPLNETLDEEIDRLWNESRECRKQVLPIAVYGIIIELLCLVMPMMWKRPFEVDDRNINSQVAESIIYIISVGLLLKLLFFRLCGLVLNKTYVQFRFDSRILLSHSLLYSVSYIIYGTALGLMIHTYPEVRYPYLISVGIHWSCISIGLILYKVY